jgi:hypothetical protein
MPRANSRNERFREGSLRIDHYDLPGGGREAMLRFGPDIGPVVVVAMPLFEEANRVRAFAVTICRALAARGVASALPDLPGQGESLAPLADCGLERICEGIEFAARALADRTIYAVGIRSGVLLDRLPILNGRWHFAPQDGADLVHELMRMKQLAKAASDTIAGNAISPGLIGDLGSAVPWTEADGGHVRTVRLDTDAKPADCRVPGMPLWRRAEPGNDPALAETLADDIADWIVACES